MRQVILQILNDPERDDILSVIPSTYYLCRMFDNNSVQFKIISEDIDLSKYNIYLRFISGNIDLGEALVNNTNESLLYDISKLYTSKSKLEVQVILRDENNDMRTNIIEFLLQGSLLIPKEFDQNLSYLNRMIIDGKVVLKLDSTDLIIYDDLENELCKIDVGSLILPHKNGGDTNED